MGNVTVWYDNNPMMAVGQSLPRSDLNEHFLFHKTCAEIGDSCRLDVRMFHN